MGRFLIRGLDQSLWAKGLDDFMRFWSAGRMVWKSVLLRGGLARGFLSHGAMAQQSPLQLNSPAASKAQADFKAASRAAHTSYAAALEPALKAAMTAGDLTEANAINR